MSKKIKKEVKFSLKDSIFNKEKVEKIAPTLSMVISQRLVRKIAPDSKEEVVDNIYYEEILKNNFQDLDQKFLENLNLNRKFYNAVPSVSYPTGIKGRQAVFEIFEVNKKIENMILEKKNEIELLKAARENGMLSIKEDAILKALDGTIPFTEINVL